ncbi:MAG: ABC transporter substrate-binding protein, partial [Phormidesmis sp.]
MKRRWFLAGLALPVVAAGCRALRDTESNSQQNSGGESGESETTEGRAVSPARNNRTLVMATAANYPPYEQVVDDGAEADAGVETSGLAGGVEAGGVEAGGVEPADIETPDDTEIVGFDIDLAQLIATRLERQLRVVNLEFGSLISAVANGEVDMAMAALEPNRDRKQQVDFSYIYYRSRHALVSVDGYLRSRDLSYQAIGVLANSVQARYALALSSELSGLKIVTYPTTVDAFAAVDSGEIDGAFVEATVANSHLRRYPELAAQLMPTDAPTGSAIALPKNSPLRSQINQALSEIKASGE